jgi:hypothetical protein
MTEGPWTLVAQSRATEASVLAAYADMGNMLQRLAAITRMHQTESARLYNHAGPSKEVLIAWENALGLLEDAVVLARHSHEAIMAHAPAVALALRKAEFTD